MLPEIRGEPQLKEYLVNKGCTQMTADVYAAMYQAFILLGGVKPSKFNEAGPTSEFGTWPGLRFIPGDEANPVWETTDRYNSSATPIRFTVTLT